MGNEQDDNTTSSIIFVQIISTDDLVLKLQGQIEKLGLLSLWVKKAIALLDRYVRVLDALGLEEDPIKRGLMIEECEASFMSSIILFHRCFVDQPTTRLQIERITTDPVLRQTYSELLQIRNDEFIHWKGVRSSLSVSYSFEVITDKEFRLGEQLNMHFKDSIGPGMSVGPLRNLYAVTDAYIEGRRNTIVDKLRKRIGEQTVFSTCKFLNEAGESIIRAADDRQ